MFAPKIQENDGHRSQYFLIEVGVLLSLVVIDYVIKFLVVRHIAYLCNPGMAFGVRIPSLFFVILWTGVIFVLGWYWYTLRRQRVIVHMAFVFIFAGAIGNSIDRVRYGCVIDYVPFFHISMFNFADVLITVGAGFLLFHIMQRQH